MDPSSSSSWSLLILLVVGHQIQYGVCQSPPRIVKQPSSEVVLRSAPVTLQCGAEGQPTPEVRWFKDGVLLAASNGRRMQLGDGGLFFLHAQLSRRDSDAGIYWCEASNRHGTVRSKNATLQVAVLREEFRLEPVETRRLLGGTALLECIPPRGTPEPVVSWKKNGQIMDLDDDERISIVDSGNLIIQDITASDEGKYQCVAKNVVGVRESAPARLKVLVKPFLIAGPIDVTSMIGESVTFECKVGGDPTPDVLWSRTGNGGNMPFGRVDILPDRSLRLNRITLEDQGEYTCEANNSLGIISASGKLSVHAEPVLNLKPVSQTVEEGHEAQFSCQAKGSPKPRVHWSVEGDLSLIYPGTFHDGYYATINKDGESKLVIKNATKANSNKIVICWALNVIGSAVGKARLMVISSEDRPPPVIIIGPSNQTLPHKSVADMTCSAEGNPTPFISWYYKNEPILATDRIEITSKGITIKDLNTEDSGPYTCVASSKNGKSVWIANLRVDSPINPSVNFFRSPELSSLPGTPSRPQIRNESDSSVTITWTQNNKIGSSSLLGYQVEMFARDTTGEGRYEAKWVVVAKRLQKTIYTQRMLVPGGAYIFLIRAENSHGFSPPSTLSETVLVDNGNSMTEHEKHDGERALSTEERIMLLTENVVNLEKVVALDSTKVLMRWTAITANFIEGYYIYYKPLFLFNSSDPTVHISTVQYSIMAEFEIMNLMKYTEYEFFMVPFHKNILGKSSNLRIVRTAEDVPEAAPTDLEVSLVNATTLYLKWKPPPAGKANGVIQEYSVVVRAGGPNSSVVVHNTTVFGGSMRLTGLGLGKSEEDTYWLQLAAATSKGRGPYSEPAALRLPLGQGLLDQYNRHHGHDLQTVVSADLLTETWFLALLGSMLMVMVLLFAAMFIIRKRHLMIKENPLPNLYDSRSGSKSLVSHLNIKAAMGLPHPMNTNYKQNNGSNVKTDSLLWVKSRPDTWRRGKDLYGMPIEYSCPSSGPTMLPDYDKIDQQQAPDYAEVEASMITFRKTSFDDSATSPAAYASVTLVTTPKNLSGSMEWTNRYGKGNKLPDNDEDLYPASNGGYFNRNVFAESYFPNPSSNMTKYSSAAQKSSLSLQNDPSSKPRDQSFSLPQNHFGTSKRIQRQQMRLAKVDNRNNEKFTSEIVERDDLRSPSLRMQENPGFGLPVEGYETCSTEDCDGYCSRSNLPPLRLNEQANPSAGQAENQHFASFKTRYREPEYQISTRSEPGSNV